MRTDTSTAPVSGFASGAASTDVRRDCRYRSLDVWRGVACIAVAIFHATFYLTKVPPAETGYQAWTVAVLLRLWAGVPLFFVISGYCISAAADALRRREHGGIANYFWRRFRRIFPPYWICLVLSMLLVYTSESFWPGIYTDAVHPFTTDLGAAQWVGNVTLTETWRFNIAGPGPRFFLGHAWTLCYEEQFYAVMGVLVLLRRRHLFRNAAIATGIVLLAMGTRLFVALPIRGFFLDGSWLYFGAGILVYHAVIHASAMARRGWVAGLALVAAAMFLRPAQLLTEEATREQNLLVAVLFAMLLIRLYRHDRGFATAAMLQPMRWCGERCYSIYLVHWPVVKLTSHAMWLLGIRGFWPTLLISLPVSLLATILVGDLFHRFVERRFLNTPTSATTSPTGVAGQSVVPA